MPQKHNRKKWRIIDSSNFHDDQLSPHLTFYANHTLHDISSIRVIPHPTFQLGLNHIAKNPNTSPSHIQFVETYNIIQLATFFNKNVNNMMFDE